MPLTETEELELLELEEEEAAASHAAPIAQEQNNAPSGIIDKRMANAQEIANKVVNEEITPASGVLQGAGQMAGVGWDAVGEAIKMALMGAGNYMKATNPRLANAAIKTGQQIAGSEAGKFVGESADKVAGKYNQLKEMEPEAVGNIEALVNLSPLAAAAKPAAIATRSVARDVAGVAKEPLGALEKMLTPKPPIKNAAQNRAAGTNWYEEVDRLGESIDPEDVKSLTSGLNSLRPKDVGRAAVWDKSGIQKNVDMINDATKKGPLTFSGASALRADINSDLKMAYRAGDDTKAMHLEKVKQTLTSAMKTPKKSSNAWQMANHEWAKQGLLEDLELIAAKASGKAQPDNSLDTAINNFLLNENASAGLRPAERLALKKVTDKTQTGELLKSAGTRLMSVGGTMVGGVPGFLVGHYGSMLSRTTAEAVKLKKLDKVYELINNRALPDPVGVPWGKAPVIKQLESPEVINHRQFMRDAVKEAEEMNLKQREIIKSGGGVYEGTVAPVSPPASSGQLPPKLLGYDRQGYIDKLKAQNDAILAKEAQANERAFKEWEIRTRKSKLKSKNKAPEVITPEAEDGQITKFLESPEGVKIREQKKLQDIREKFIEKSIKDMEAQNAKQAKIQARKDRQAKLKSDNIEAAKAKKLSDMAKKGKPK